MVLYNLALEIGVVKLYYLFFNKLKRDMNNIDEWFDNMTIDEIVEYGKELDADLLIGTIDYHYNVE